jgi:hypothetical protein
VFPSTKTPTLYLEEMHGLIEEKKTRRKNLNIFVLSSDGYKKNSKSELSIFFKLLTKSINNPKTPTRFQLAIENERHWFCVDCYIKNSKVYLLVLDAAVLNRSIEIIKEASLNLQPVIFAYSGLQIQYDFEHCSFFTLDHLFRLSNRDQHWADLTSFSSLSPGTIIYFDHQICPSSLAFIFKNIQSLENFSLLPDSLKKTVINKNQTLEQFINKNKRSVNFLGIENKIINGGILLKEKKYMKRGINFFNLNNDSSLVSNRQGFDIIGGKLGKLINRVINHKGKFCFKFLSKNKLILKNNMREILDSIIYYELKKFLIFLIETEYLDKEYITISDVCSLMNKNPAMFKAILQYVKNSLSYADILEISEEINLYGNDQCKEYFSSLSFKESYSYFSFSNIF